jgi:hypothetical protein
MPRCQVVEDGETCGLWTSRASGLCHIHEEAALVARTEADVEAGKIGQYGFVVDLGLERHADEKRSAPMTAAEIAAATARAGKEKPTMTDEAKRTRRGSIPQRPGETDEEYKRRKYRIKNAIYGNRPVQEADLWPGYQEWLAGGNGNGRTARDDETAKVVATPKVIPVTAGTGPANKNWSVECKVGRYVEAGLVLKVGQWLNSDEGRAVLDLCQTAQSLAIAMAFIAGASRS